MSEKTNIMTEASAALTSSTSKVAVFGSGASFAAWWASLDLIALISITVAVISVLVSVCSFFMNLKFQREKNKREKEIHEITLRNMRIKNSAKE